MLTWYVIISLKPTNPLQVTMDIIMSDLQNYQPDMLVGFDYQWFRLEVLINCLY